MSTATGPSHSRIWRVLACLFRVERAKVVESCPAYQQMEPDLRLELQRVCGEKANARETYLLIEFVAWHVTVCILLTGPLFVGEDHGSLKAIGAGLFLGLMVFISGVTHPFYERMKVGRIWYYIARSLAESKKSD